MSEIKFRLTGGKAILALILVAAFFGYRYYALRTTLDTGATDELKLWLVSEYIAHGLPALEQAVAAGDAQAAEAQAAEIINRERVEFTSVSARGGGDDVVVRVEIRVDGEPPPVGKPVRYFRMTHSLVTGWRMQREVWALSYFLKLF